MKIKLFFSFDDGHPLDNKTAELLDKYYFKATFFIPIESWGFNHMEVYQNHHVGGHTRTHPRDLKLLSPDELHDEVVISKIMLRIRAGKPIKDFCYPKGKYNEGVMEYVKMAGYRYARTVDILRTDLDWERYRMPATIHIFPHRKEYNGKKWLQTALDILDQKDKPRYFHVFGHSKEIESHNQWKEFEELLKRLLYENFINQ
jgi:peptidoglycan/xylan/chitin deacetylase (PgdA/CDA1 family)